MTPIAALKNGLSRLGSGLRERLRAAARIHAPVVLLVGAGQDECLMALAAAARPSAERLHLRELFRDGRRYYLSPTADGFRLYSDAKRWGSGAGRTSPAAVLVGELAAMGSASAPATLLRLQVHMRPAYVLSALAFPAFVALLVVASPVENPWKPLLAGAIIALSLLTQRFETAYQAHVLVEFARKALDGLPRIDSLQLDGGRGPVVDGSAGFAQAWDRFYAEQTGQEPGA